MTKSQLTKRLQAVEDTKGIWSIEREKRLSEAKLFQDANKIQQALRILYEVKDACPRMKWAIENLESVEQFYQSELKILHGECYE